MTRREIDPVRGVRCSACPARSWAYLFHSGWNIYLANGRLALLAGCGGAGALNGVLITGLGFALDRG